MLIFSIPRQAAPGFMKGDPAPVKINGVPRQLTYDAEANAVKFTDDKGPQSRKVIGVSEEGDLVRFWCTGADGSGIVFAPNAPRGITADG
jgi:hypothetical protein